MGAGLPHDRIENVMLEQVADILFSTSAVFFVCAALLVFYLFARARQGLFDSKPIEPNNEFDAMQLTILFQSMRDTLRQQKQLAAEINETVERRVSYIRKTVDLALEELTRIDARQQELARAMDAMKDDASVHITNEHSVPAEAKSMNGNGHASQSNGHSHTSDALHVLPGQRRAPFDLSSDPEDSWVGLDFGRVDADSETVRNEPTPPTAPEDAEAARDAFRALLDMDANPSPSAVVTNNSAPNPAVHGRVYEYADAGMTTPAIARELGIGKGEVRLILGLRKDRES